MKAKRFTITAFLLCAIMVLGIGFATLVDELDITGTVEISKTQADATFDGDIHFDVEGFDATRHIVKSGSEHHTTNVTAGGTVQFGAEGDNATFMSTTFADKGDSTAITFSIVNEFSKDVTVEAAVTYTVNGTGDNVFTATIAGTGWVDNKTTIGASADGTHGTTTFVLTVVLNEVPEETINVTINVHFIVTAVSD